VVGHSRRNPDTGGPLQHFNAAIVLDNFGHPIRGLTTGGRQSWLQSKRNGYTLKPYDQYQRKITACFQGNAVVREEGICPGTELLIFEGRHRRFAILICEDWSQESGTCQYLRRMNCSVVFVPIMDVAPVEQSKWYANKASFIGEEEGVSAVVANSLLLPLGDAVGEAPGVGLVHMPASADQPPIWRVLPARGAPVADEDFVSEPGALPPRIT
jgi:hypothetical protein